MADLNWRDHKACGPEDHALFFPAGIPGRQGSPPDYGPAKKICARCPVREECLEYGLAGEVPNERHGVYGGRTPSQRQSIYRKAHRGPR